MSHVKEWVPIEESAPERFVDQYVRGGGAETVGRVLQWVGRGTRKCGTGTVRYTTRSKV